MCEYAQSINWHKVAGTRMYAGETLYNDPDTLTDIIVLSIVNEAFRFYTNWMFVVGSRVKDTSAQPPLMDLVNTPFSPILVVRQFFSSVLAGVRFEGFRMRNLDP
jgi:hypothetical protein